MFCLTEVLNCRRSVTKFGDTQKRRAHSKRVLMRKRKASIIPWSNRRETAADGYSVQLDVYVQVKFLRSIT